MSRGGGCEGVVGSVCESVGVVGSVWVGGGGWRMGSVHVCQYG